MTQENTVVALQLWLAEQGIDTTTWGRNGAKTVSDLWDELQNGDIKLHGDPPLREVALVQVFIWREQQVLLELAQEFDSGYQRQRLIPPSEKLRGGESYQEAAVRGLYEEMGIAPENICFVADSYRQFYRDTVSPSYPGLPTRYTVHRIEAEVTGLPDVDFWWENEAHGAGDPVRRHQWGWRPAADIPPFR
ncbi:MAG: NUDIX domain-containing protein [Anaerolineales bacterium]|nr:NUDIX domain-containing protein [Anaerolineales bacterium]